MIKYATKAFDDMSPVRVETTAHQKIKRLAGFCEKIQIKFVGIRVLLYLVLQPLYIYCDFESYNAK